MNGNKMNGMNGCGCGNQMNRPNNGCGCESDHIKHINIYLCLDKLIKIIKKLS